MRRIAGATRAHNRVRAVAAWAGFLILIRGMWATWLGACLAAALGNCAGNHGYARGCDPFGPGHSCGAAHGLRGPRERCACLL